MQCPGTEVAAGCTPFANQDVRAQLPEAPVLPGSWERHSLLIGLGTPSGNGNVLTYYSLMICAETKQACPKPVLDVRKIMLEHECRHVSGMVPTVLLKEDFPGLSLV